MSQNNLNQIQQLCTGDEEFVAGEIYGLRQWTYADTLRPGGDRYALVGHRSHFWDIHEENVASCARSHFSEDKRISVDIDPWSNNPSAEDALLGAIGKVFERDPQITSLTAYAPGSALTPRSFFPDQFANGFTPHWETMFWFVRDWNRGYQTISLILDCNKKLPPHNVSDPQCTCGFYAYTDEQSLRDNSLKPGFDGRLFGIVKAYGHVTEGTKGFRAEKAQIVALTPPLTLERRSDNLNYLSWGVAVDPEKLHEWEWVPGNDSLWHRAILATLPPELKICTTFTELIETFKGYQGRGR